jgi:HlyD family secretion protein
VISATGTIEPEEVVDVGAQVGGKILSFGKDGSGEQIDYGSEVEEGTVLARIDDSLYAAEVDRAKSRLEEAKSGLRRSEANLGQLQSKLVQAEREWKRVEKLGPSSALSQKAYDAALSDFEVAAANLEVGKAAIDQSRNAIAHAEADLKYAQQNLDYCIIRSPVKGVIIDRRVNIGQTVVSSLNAPSLFLIAKDLRRMEVWVLVNEADIGNIHPGQPVTFTVDAFPGQLFHGQTSKIRLNAIMTQNVVNYTVEVATDNSDGKLLPYLTANIKFMLNNRPNVLMVPNSALRWYPQQEKIAPEGRSRLAVAKTEGADSTGADQEGYESGLVWVQEGAYVKSIPVRVGVTDGTMTEIQGDRIKEGMQVVMGEQPRKESNQAISPFAPRRPSKVEPSAEKDS